MSFPTKRQMVNHLNTLLNKIPNNTPLEQWLKQASEIDPRLNEALEGIYCGREGRIHEQLGESNIWLTMGWNTVLNTPKVEYAYFS